MDFLRRGPAAFGLGWAARQAWNYVDPVNAGRWARRRTALRYLYNRLHDWVYPRLDDPFDVRQVPTWGPNRFLPYINRAKALAPAVGVGAAGALISASSRFANLRYAKDVADQAKFKHFKTPLPQHPIFPVQHDPYDEKDFSYEFVPPLSDYALEPPLGAMRLRIVQHPYSRLPIREKAGGGVEYLPPLKRTHTGIGPWQDLEVGFKQRLPESVDIELATRFTVTYIALSDQGAYRNMTYQIYPSMVMNLFSGLVPSGNSPGTYAHDAERMFSLYDKVHVKGFSIKMSSRFYQGAEQTPVQCAYVEDGWADAALQSLPLTSYSDCADWGSQKYGHMKIVNTHLNQPQNTIVWQWDIDCARDFGPEVAADNRIDQKSDGNPVVGGATAKWYILHVGTFQPADTTGWTPIIDYEFIQRCRFYDPKSLTA